MIVENVEGKIRWEAGVVAGLVVETLSSGGSEHLGRGLSFLLSAKDGSSPFRRMDSKSVIKTVSWNLALWAFVGMKKDYEFLDEPRYYPTEDFYIQRLEQYKNVIDSRSEGLDTDPQMAGEALVFFRSLSTYCLDSRGSLLAS